MDKISSLSIIIPAFNDEVTIEKVLAQAVQIGEEYSNQYEIVVIDDGSTDKTYKKIERESQKNKRIKFKYHLKNLGFGVTIKELYYSARYDYIFSIPGDRQIRADVIKLLIPQLKTHDFIIGLRKKRMDSWLRRLQSRSYNRLMRILFQINLRDVNSTKLFPRSILGQISLVTSSAFIDTELCIKTIRNGFKISEVEIPHYPRGALGGIGVMNLKIVLPVIRDLIIFWGTRLLMKSIIFI
ncbi:hypothetical protein A2960_04060 [Candidatus Gottesmanbacteria bacterium RIFCSPLOWO2_01_FULL_39_12b]|uniref:Glycosyltransferase 2-like domain-containing protein n=1 Tax=Candidatus Gottesmanbacteria bacterium RIFCSPLOWO2_01_FULL_39_12b TaxID=1798388 RepID=A0A1F6AN62_9BACT|nr:MAG: hypothetical protein A2960_04060 [Candidatus Gottesmanbacteria bacterium RIFCSPLOWO2_01_FULL_39_12b]